jgi:hypothetical protein
MAKGEIRKYDKENGKLKSEEETSTVTMAIDEKPALKRVTCYRTSQSLKV